MKTIPKTLVLLAAWLAGLALVASAAGTAASGTKSIRPHGTVVALALDGARVAFGNGPGVFVWNVRTGKVTNLHMGEDAYLGGLAIAGSRVVSYWKASGNLESDDYLLVSSPASSKGRLVATAARTGQAQCGAAGGGPTPACAGPWLGGLVGSGNRILVNRWTTDTSGAVSNAGLYAVVGSRFKRVVAGPDTVEAVAADSQRVAVLQWRWYVPGRTIHVFSSTGRRLSSVTPKGSPLEVAVSGSNLVVLERSGVLALYNANTGSLRRTFNLHATQALAVHGNIAVYSRPTRIVQRIVRASAIHALNLSTGKNRVVGRSPGQIAFAGIDSVGLVYAAGRWPRNSIVFVPFARVSAAVS